MSLSESGLSFVNVFLCILLCMYSATLEIENTEYNQQKDFGLAWGFLGCATWASKSNIEHVLLS